MNKLNIGIVLLAAGSSSRMGSSKQLLKVNGKPLLASSIEAAISSVAEKTVVVLGARNEAHKTITSNFPVEIFVNTSWQHGMGSSLKAGINFLLRLDPSIDGVVMLVCDQPLLTAEHINKIIKKHLDTDKPIIASGYSQTAGVPVFFDKSYFEKILLHLKDQQGAKKIILENQNDVAIVDFPEGEIDLDTLEDYERFIKLNNGSRIAQK